MRQCRQFTALRFMLIIAILFARLLNADAAELIVMQKEELQQKSSSAPSPLRFQAALGQALAEQMNRKVRYLDLPRKRFAEALEAGEGDILCGYLPDWLPGAFDWSKPFLPVTEIVVTAKRAKKPASILELKGQRIGTLIGFVYPDLEKALGENFIRDDAPSIESSMRKLATGRFDHVATTAAGLHSQTMQKDFSLPLHAPLTIKEFKTQCAISKNGNVKVDEVNKAIDTILKNGKLTDLIQHYH